MKKLLTLILLAAICLPVLSCDRYARYEKYDTILELLENGDYDDAIEEIKDLAGYDDEDKENSSPNFTPDPPQTNGNSSLQIGVITTTSNGEFAVDFSNIAKKITPPTPDSYYSYYEADNGKVYVDLCIQYKNTAATAVDADEVVTKGKLIYQGKYEYSGFTILEEDNRGDFTYTNISEISPLCTEYLHYLFEVPAEVETNEQSIEIQFEIDGTTYTYKVR